MEMDKEMVRTVGDREHEFFVGLALADVRSYWSLPPLAGVLLDSSHKSVQTIVAGGGPYFLDVDPSVFPQGTH